VVIAEALLLIELFADELTGGVPKLYLRLLSMSWEGIALVV